MTLALKLCIECGRMLSGGKNEVGREREEGGREKGREGGREGGKDES